jgi:glycine/D-amino acid oxidase-like deaminating enzyme
VTLVEQYTPGHVRSGSGGDTRLLRFSHGEVEWYTLLARRALELWREVEAEAGLRLFEPVGLAFDSFGRPYVTDAATSASLYPNSTTTPSPVSRTSLARRAW